MSEILSISNISQEIVNNSEIIQDNNVTVRNDELMSSSSLPLVFYFVFLGCGVLVNLIYVLALLRSNRNGMLTLLLQIFLVDAFAFYVALTEILSLYHGTWNFSADTCPIYKGTEVLLNTLTVYLLICLNFHSISTWNLHELQQKKNGKNPLTSSSSEESVECLVSSNRLVTVDYTKRKNDISITFPTILIWIVSLSLSLPNYALSSTLRLRENSTICAVVDVFYGQALQFSLAIFKVILPVVLLLLSFIIVAVKLWQTSHKDDDLFNKQMCDIRKLLWYSVILTVLYFVTSLQRHILHLLYIISYFFDKNTVYIFKTPPLHNVNFTSNIIVFAMLHYSSCTFRCLLSFFALPKFSDLVRTKVLVCCTKIKQ